MFIVVLYLYFSKGGGEGSGLVFSSSESQLKCSSLCVHDHLLSLKYFLSISDKRWS